MVFGIPGISAIAQTPPTNPNTSCLSLAPWPKANRLRLVVDVVFRVQ
jgi:hypothetical protein